MITKLLEFKNQRQELLRGILAIGGGDNQHVVIMLGGFERAGTTERKFKILADELAKNDVASFRFDAADCGLSDGSFYHMTTKSLSEDILSAIDFLKIQGYERFSIVGHSLAACAISLLLDEIVFEKIVLISPALNQRDLLRLWFAQKNNKDAEVNWENYKEHYKESDFILDLENDMLTKTHKINREYKVENQAVDYSENYNKISTDKILLIQGNNDDKVPLESINVNFSNKMIIDKGDHDLEKAGIIEGWYKNAVDFLKNC